MSEAAVQIPDGIYGNDNIKVEVREEDDKGLGLVYPNGITMRVSKNYFESMKLKLVEEF